MRFRFRFSDPMLSSLSIAVVCLSTITLNVISTLTPSDRELGNFNPKEKEAIQRNIDSGCLECICKQDSNCNHTEACKFDTNGEACGAYQIHKSYFQSCCALLGMTNCDSDSTWRTCALDYTCATRCVTVRRMHADQIVTNLYVIS